MVQNIHGMLVNLTLKERRNTINYTFKHCAKIHFTIPLCPFHEMQ